MEAGDKRSNEEGGQNAPRLDVSGRVPAPFTVDLIHTVSIGRANENLVALPNNPRVSRFHALLRAVEDNRFQVVDLGSRNGTFVDGRRVVFPQIARDGSVIAVGDVDVTVRLPEKPKTSEAETSAGEGSGQLSLLVVTLDTFGPPTDEDPDRGRWLGRFFRIACQHVLATGGWINHFRQNSLIVYWEDREHRPSCAQLATESALAILTAARDIQSPDGFQTRPGVTVHFGGAHWLGGVVEPGEPVRGEACDAAIELDRIRQSEGLPFVLTEPCLATLPDHLLLKLNDLGPLRYGSKGKTARSFGLNRV